MKSTLVLSAAAHVLFLAAIIVPAYQGRDMANGEIINVSLVGGGGGPVPRPGAEAAAGISKEPEPAKPEQSKMAYKATKKDKPKPAGKTKAKSRSGQASSEGKASDGKSRGTGGPGGPGGGNIVVDDEDFRFAYYLEAIRERISYNWEPPALLGAPSEVTATVFFKISRDGTINEAKVEKTSNHEIFDRAAVRAVKLADPLPPLPGGFRGRWLGVHFEFQHNPG